MTGGVYSARGEMKLTRPTNGAATPSTKTRTRIARMNGADPRLRHERAHLDVLRRQQDDDGPARRDPFSLAIEGVEDEARPAGRTAASAKGPIPPGVSRCSS